VIQGPWLSPNAIFHAGSRDWKNSSGWKNVRTVRALTRRKAMRKRRMLLDASGGGDGGLRREGGGTEVVTGAGVEGENGCAASEAGLGA
jgi:hypothetical protein